MKRDPLDDFATLDRAALERFTTELVEAGFNPDPVTNGRDWLGPIHPALRALTSATHMRIRFREGWPFEFPHVLVQGLDVEHVNEIGVVCLWQEGDPSREWMTLDGVNSRIASWSQQAVSGFDEEHAALDAYLGPHNVEPRLVVFDPTSFGPGHFADGQMGPIWGQMLRDDLLQVQVGHSASHAMKGQWYYREGIQIPPRSYDEFAAALTSSQRRNLERGSREGRDEASLNFAILLFPRAELLDALVVALGGGSPTFLIPAPNDTRTLLLRAGPDASALLGKSVTVFGCGAIGSHLSLLLAEGGVGRLRIVDGDHLRPGNVVRHVGGHDLVGFPKTGATRRVIANHAPWCSVETRSRSTLNHEEIALIAKDADLIIDAIGSAPFTELVGRVTERGSQPLVSFALYRGGALSRIRRQDPYDIPIRQRTALGAPSIPRLRDERAEFAGLEMGCSAPANNAPASSVTSAASLAARVANDTLLGTHRYPQELIEVLEPQSDPPFDQLGLISWDADERRQGPNL